MTDPIGVRLDEKTRSQLEKDAKSIGMATSTYANKILTDWISNYGPMLESDNVIFPITLLKMFYNFTKESDHEIIANLISEYWHASIKTSKESPTIDDYVQSLETWANNTGQRFSVFNNNGIKHVFHHDWGFSYSKITSVMIKKTFESIGCEIKNMEVNENMFSYYIHKKMNFL